MATEEDAELRRLIHADFSLDSSAAKAEVPPPAVSGGKKKPRKSTGKEDKAPPPVARAAPPNQVFLCEKCEKTYKTKNGLIKHKLTCLK